MRSLALRFSRRINAEYATLTLPQIKNYASIFGAARVVADRLIRIVKGDGYGSVGRKTTYVEAMVEKLRIVQREQC